MNELDPDTREALMELAEQSSICADMCEVLMQMHKYGGEGYSLEDTIKAVMEAVG